MSSPGDKWGQISYAQHLCSAGFTFACVCRPLVEHCISTKNRKIATTPTFRQCSGNIVWILWQCRSPTLGIDVETLFGICCMNVMAMSLSTLGTDIKTTFRQHGVSTSMHNVVEWHWDNIQAMFVNFEAMSLAMLGLDVEITFRQHCMNAVW